MAEVSEELDDAVNHAAALIRGGVDYPRRIVRMVDHQSEDGQRDHCTDDLLQEAAASLHVREHVLSHLILLRSGPVSAVDVVDFMKQAAELHEQGTLGGTLVHWGTVEPGEVGQ